jgi:4-amino-4-deoxy-L-arabinose transferase-like glycosyltransferase
LAPQPEKTTMIPTSPAAHTPTGRPAAVHSAWRGAPRDLLLLAVIVVGYLVIGSLYAARTPPWQVPDEPAHYNYVAQVAWVGLPVLEAGDWDSAYLERIKAAGFRADAPEGRLDTIQYEDHQPPLYYLLASVIYRLFNGALLPLRLFSLAIGSLTVLVAFATVRRIFPAQGYLALGTAAVVAFVPQHLAMMGGVNNDCLTELIVGLGVYGGVRLVTGGAGLLVGRYAALLGLILGLGFITKATAYSLIFIVGAALLLRAQRDHTRPAQVIRWIGIAAVPALILGGAWWLRNIDVYGFPDILGLIRHGVVVVGQPRTAEIIAQRGFGGYLATAIQTSFQSFWGQFGWMGVVLPRQIVDALVIANTFLLMGASVAFVQFRALVSPAQRDGLLLLGLSAGLALALFVYYNLEFAQWQGRYTYTGLIAFGFYFTAALVGWASLVRPKAARWVLITGGAALLAFFAVYALFRILIPNLPLVG